MKRLLQGFMFLIGFSLAIGMIGEYLNDGFQHNFYDYLVSIPLGIIIIMIFGIVAIFIEELYS